MFSPLFSLQFSSKHKKYSMFLTICLQSSNHKDFYMLNFQCSKKIIIAGFIIMMDNGNNNNINAEDQGRCKIGLSLDSKQILHFNGFLLPILTLETLF